MIIGLCGAAGAGKSAVAAELCSARGFVQVSLADPLKEACQAWFGFSREQLWGPSAARNAPDPRWGGLSARRALQLIGTEGARAAHPDVWVRLALQRAQERLAFRRGPHTERCRDSNRFGDGYDCNCQPEECVGVVVPDVRFPNEAAALRAAGGRLVRVVRPGAGLVGAAGEHSSEGFALEADLELQNSGSLLALLEQARALPERLK